MIEILHDFMYQNCRKAMVVWYGVMQSCRISIINRIPSEFAGQRHLLGTVGLVLSNLSPRCASRTKRVQVPKCHGI